MQRLDLYLIICLFVSIVVIYILLFGNKHANQSVYDLRDQITTYFCTDKSSMKASHLCGTDARCWAWCHHSNRLAYNDWKSKAKLCYTTPRPKKLSLFDSSQRSCTLNSDCYAKTKCVNKCYPGCKKAENEDSFFPEE